MKRKGVFFVNGKTLPENDIILRLYAPPESNEEVKIQDWWGIKWKKVSMNEKEIKSGFSLSPWEIGTFQGEYEKSKVKKLVKLNPVFVKYYYHNELVEPPGFMPVIAEFGKIGKQKVEIKIVNNTSKEIYVNIEITGYDINIQDEIYSQLLPFEYEIQNVPYSGNSGKIKLQYKWENLTYYDIIHINTTPELQVVESNRLNFKLKNLSKYPISTKCELLFPIEGWGEKQYSSWSISENEKYYEIEPDKEVIVYFNPKKIKQSSLYVVPKITYEGEIKYLKEIILE